jgi:hypothetical protein
MTMANLRIPGVLAASLLWAPMITGPAAAVEMTAGKPSAEAEALAGQVRTAAQTGAGDALGVLYKRLADKVQLDHVPAGPNDGPFDGSAIANGGPAEIAAVRKVVPDFQHQILEVKAAGDAVEVAQQYRGTMPDGSKLDWKSRLTFVLSGGKVTRLISKGEGDAEQRAKLQMAMKQGGFAPNAGAKKD